MILQQTRGALSSGLDADALTYIRAVEAADGQALETAVRTAYNTFIKGCKADGIWSAINASCILAGARTLSGALVPLRGATPTNFNFVSADYNRKTGLVGNASSKYLLSNATTSDVPQSNNHSIIEVQSWNTNSGFPVGRTDYVHRRAGTDYRFTNYNSNITMTLSGTGANIGFIGMTRSSSTRTDARHSSTNYSNTTQASQTPASGPFPIFVFYNTTTQVIGNFSDARLRFYSLGTSLGSGATGLTNFQNRVDTLLASLQTAIP